ncbi:hypothetical protein ACLBWP_05085 [Microbacterium sp. M1A1_1b]
MSTQAAPTTTARPTVVTIAAAIWWVETVVRLAVGVPRLLVSLGTEDTGLLVATVVGGVLFLALTLFFGWLALRMWRGSGTARLWLAIIAGLGVVSTLIGLVTTPPDWSLLEPIALAAAAVLSYLPSARGWFPKAERRPRRVEPKTLGWDPETGERITEDTER